jgi:hypothetical protein
MAPTFSPADHRGKEFLFEGFGAVLIEIGRGHVRMHQDAHGQAAGAAPSQLLAEDDGAPDIGAGAAVLFVVADPQKAQFTHSSVDVFGEDAGGFPLVHVGVEFLFDEASDSLAEDTMLFRERVVHSTLLYQMLMA